MRAGRLVGAIVAGIVLAGIVAPVHARRPVGCVGIDKAASECKAQTCEKLFEKNLAACAELPSNKSCSVLARSQRRQCDQSCDNTYRKRSTCPEN
jgi:hypothetical protein